MHAPDLSCPHKTFTSFNSVSRVVSHRGPPATISLNCTLCLPLKCFSRVDERDPHVVCASRSCERRSKSLTGLTTVDHETWRRGETQVRPSWPESTKVCVWPHEAVRAHVFGCVCVCAHTHMSLTCVRRVCMRVVACGVVNSEWWSRVRSHWAETAATTISSFDQYKLMADESAHDATARASQYPKQRSALRKHHRALCGPSAAPPSPPSCLLLLPPLAPPTHLPKQSRRTS